VTYIRLKIFFNDFGTKKSCFTKEMLSKILAFLSLTGAGGVQKSLTYLTESLRVMFDRLGAPCSMPMKST